MLKCLNLNVNILAKDSDIHNYSTRNNNKLLLLLLHQNVT